MESTDNRQVRVFISSTFRDMHAERDHLVTVVFPELRERLELLGLEFFDVDLRWGVPEKDANGETANSWEYCRQWIDRVEPFFICILGQRYGWVPEPEKLKSTEEQTRQEKDPRSITDMEVQHAVLDGGNKRHSFFYIRDAQIPEETDKAIYDEYVDPFDEQRKLDALKTQIRSSGRPVRDYPCRWNEDGFEDLQAFGDQVLEDLWSAVLRDQRYVSKDIWKKALNADPDSDPQYTDIDAPISSSLWQKLVELAKPKPLSPLDAEQQQMMKFAESRLRWFQGRSKELNALSDFIFSPSDQESSRLAVVAALPGQGKSALFSRLWKSLSDSVESESYFIHAHFVGATEESANSRSLVLRILEELDRNGFEWSEEKSNKEPKLDYNSLCLRLSERLRDYSGDRRIVLILDALNQLSDGHNLSWLPYQLGSSVRVVVSCINDPKAKQVSPEQKVLQSLESRHPAPLRIPVGALTENDIRTIVIKYLKEYCKQLDEPQVNAICNLPQAKSPLYLLVMLGELRSLGGNNMNVKVPKLIVEMSKNYPDIVSLFDWVLERLEVFGKREVRHWCMYLTLGRSGMGSRELSALLEQQFKDRGAKTALRIERGIRRYLLQRGEQLDFFHGQFKAAVLGRYDSASNSEQLHEEIAGYFTAEAKGINLDAAWETDTKRGFGECIYHHVQAGEYDQATGLLCNFPFLLNKMRLGLLEGVLEDYKLVSDKAPLRINTQLEVWDSFFNEKAHILRRGNEEWPAHKIFLQLAIEHADDSPLSISAEHWLAEGHCKWLWLCRARRSPYVQCSPFLMCLEGHFGSIYGAREMSGSRFLSWSIDRSLRLWDGQSGECLSVLKGHTDCIKGAMELSDSRILSWSADGTLRLWDGRGGICIAVLKGHTGCIKGAMELSDSRILSWSADGTLRLWDEHDGRCSAVLGGCSDGIAGVMVLSDGKVLSWSEGGTSLLWNRQSGERHIVLEGHAGSIVGVCELTDGRILSWSEERTLCLWDRQCGECSTVLNGHTGSIVGAMELSNGNILSWSRDGMLRLWDGKDGVCLTIFKGHTKSIKGARELSSGRILSWSADKTMRLWDGKRGVCLAVLSGHTLMIYGIQVLANGRILSWSMDGTLRLWDGERGVCLSVLKGDPEPNLGALGLTNGGILLWAWDQLRLWNGHGGLDQSLLDGHSQKVLDARELSGGRVLSWALEGTLRLWDGQSGRCIAVLKGHSRLVAGALELFDGRILSWSYDGTLRLWGESGASLTVLKGHSDKITRGKELPDGKILSWSDDQTMRLWDGESGDCIEVIPSNQVAIIHPEWLQKTRSDRFRECIEGGFYGDSVDCCSRRLHFKNLSHVVAVWQEGSSVTSSRCLLSDGTFVVSQENGQVCFLKLHFGNRRISLAEAEELLPQLHST